MLPRGVFGVAVYVNLRKHAYSETYDVCLVLFVGLTVNHIDKHPLFRLARVQSSIFLSIFKFNYEGRMSSV